MRIRKRNNIIYWLGFSMFFVPLIFGFIYYLFKGDLFTDNYYASLENLLSSYGDGTFHNDYYDWTMWEYIISSPLFGWAINVADFLIGDVSGETSAYANLFYNFILWILIYNEIWLFIRVFLWFFDIPNEILERSVNIV